jgi:hypothetical protein
MLIAAGTIFISVTKLIILASASCITFDKKCCVRVGVSIFNQTFVGFEVVKVRRNLIANWRGGQFEISGKRSLCVLPRKHDIQVLLA